MIYLELFFIVIYVLHSSAAAADELCDSAGRPFANYNPVKSEYFGAISLAGSFPPIVLGELHDEYISRSSWLHPGVRFGYWQELIIPNVTRADQTEFGLFNFLNTSQRLAYVQKSSYEQFRVLYPPPENSEGDEKRVSALSKAEKAELSACREAIPSAKGLQNDTNPNEVNPFEACALLHFEKSCLTNSNLPDTFQDKTSFRKAVVGITSSAGQPYCMGTLTNKNGQFRIITSRHCFINRSTGKLEATLKLRSGKTLDGKRLISIHESDLKKLEMPCSDICELPIGAYGPERDAVTVRVTVNELPGATSLPEVKMDPSVKGCTTEKLYDMNNICTRVIVPGVVPDLLAAKKLESQATKIPVSGTWLDEVRWPKWFGGYTRLDYLEEHCAYYTSQTIGGFSGAPLITRTTNEKNQTIVYIAGVHSGATSASKYAWPACATAAKNPSKDRLRLNIADVEVDKP